MPLIPGYENNNFILEDSWITKRTNPHGGRINELSLFLCLSFVLFVLVPFSKLTASLTSSGKKWHSRLNCCFLAFESWNLRKRREYPKDEKNCRGTSLEVQWLGLWIFCREAVGSPGLISGHRVRIPQVARLSKEKESAGAYQVAQW